MMALREVIRAKPDDVPALCALGMALSQQPNRGAREEAVTLLRKAARLHPDDATASTALGHALRRIGAIAEAVGIFARCVQHFPDNPEARNNLGVVLQEAGDLTNGIAQLCQAVRLRPDYSEAHWNLSLALLLTGNFTRGWIEYEWRKRIDAAEWEERRVPQPEWNGCRIDGCTILLRTEQGLGDTIQFVRYASLLKDRGARAVVECQPSLAPLLRTALGVDDVIERGGLLPAFDVHCRLLSLPGIFGTDGGSVPAPIPYLSADAERVSRWKKRLAGIAGFKIGVVWQGSASFAADHRRSIPLSEFEPLARVPGVQLIALQKGLGKEQLSEVAECFIVHDLGQPDQEGAGAFLDTAAAIEAGLDLVITSDTSVAHLAGALGAATWVALADAPDWRWLLQREDSPWYPTMRLFRQKTAGNWTEVFERMAAQVATLAGTQRPVQELLIPVSPGELVDRLTILQTKSQRIADAAKLSHVREELKRLQAVASASLSPSPELDRLTVKLLEVNSALWDVEEALRGCEAAGTFGPEFEALARSVYHLNDERGRLKQRVNILLGARIVEVKSYPKYDKADPE